MVECLETEFSLGYVADRLATFTTGSEAEPRAVGWHISSLNKAAREIVKGKAIDPEYYYCSEDSPDMDGLIDEIPEGILDWGNIWEAACRPALADIARDKFGLLATGPRQIIKEGIVANADALIVHPSSEQVIAVAECKFRFTHNTDPLNMEDWIRQIKAYCYVWETNMVWMPVANVRNSPPGGKSRIYMLMFTNQEINENWQMLINVKDYMEELRQNYATNY